jgi:hypothetical protein
MSPKRNDFEQLLKSRFWTFVVGLLVLAPSIGCLAVVHDFLGDRRDFDGFDWFVCLFFSEFFCAAMLLGVLLVVCALMDPSWLRTLLTGAGHHVMWLATLFFVGIIVVGAVGGLVIMPILMMLGLLE